MKYGQLIEYDKAIFFIKNHAKNAVERIVSDPIFVFLKKALYEVNATDLQLSFNIF